jgi:RecB family exonuclease
MSRDDVLKQLKELGLTGEFKKEGNQTIIQVEKESNSEGPKDITPVESEDSKEQEKV